MKFALSRTPKSDNGSIRCIDGSALDRPLELPAKVRAAMIPLLVAAVVIGAAMLYIVLDNVLNANAREQASMEEVLSKHLAITLPNMASLINSSDSEILDALQATGDTILDIGSLKGDDYLNIAKLPADMTIDQATAFYVKGLNNLSSPELVSLLYGAWDMDVTRDAGINMSLHYVDFDSPDEKTAVQVAMSAERFTAEMSRDSGTDESGNTFTTGDIPVGDSVYSWRVSCIPASDIYSQSNLPKAYYVGIRIYS